MAKKKKRQAAVAGEQSAAVAGAEASAVPAGGVVRVATLSELEAAVNEELDLVVKLPGNRTMLVPVRRLTPAESARLFELLEESVPPVKKVSGPDGVEREEFDLANGPYRKKQRERERECRALALWWACPLFRASPAAPAGTEPGAEPTASQIVTFVEGRLTEDILEQIYTVARALDLEVMRRVNF